MQSSAYWNETVAVYRNLGGSDLSTKLAGLDSNTQLFAAAVIAGITTHLGYFIRGEHHVYVTTIVKFYAALDVVIIGLFIGANGGDVKVGAMKAAIVVASYLLGLFGSIAIYRAFFHRLNGFKGPFLARLSNLYHSSLCLNSDNYRVIDNLHKKYGPIVRTGPSNLSILDPEAIQLVYGSESPTDKNAWYDTSLPLVNLHTVRDKKVHELRRKVWARAFSPKALHEYDERIAEYSALFCQQIAHMKGQPFDATRWFKFYAWDVMGELGFGESFHMLEDDKNRWVPDLLEEGMADIAQLQPVPWATILFHRLPFLFEGPKKFAVFIIEQAMRRAKQTPTKPDVLKYLVEDYEKSAKTDRDFQWFRGDTRLFVVGGSDTTAATLTHIMYYLAIYPEQVAKLRAELEPLLQGRTLLDPKDVQAAKHLNGVIHEVLRLHPPIPSGFPRLTPKGGMVIRGTYIPENTTVVVPVWAMGRSEEAYARPLEFIPERWYSQPELIKNKNAFAAFGLGPYACIGKALALQEMRNMMCHILTRFESFELAPGEDGSQLMNKTKDHFTMGIQSLKMIFKSK